MSGTTTAWFARAARQTLATLGVLWAGALVWTCVTFGLALDAWLRHRSNPSAISQVFDGVFSFLSVVELATFGSLLLFLTWLAVPRARRARVELLLDGVLTLLLFSLLSPRQEPYMMIRFIRVLVAFEGLRITVVSLLQSRREAVMDAPSLYEEPGAR